MAYAFSPERKEKVLTRLKMQKHEMYLEWERQIEGNE